jgi:hypothetical protein
MSRLKSLSHCAAPGYQPAFPCHTQMRHRPTGLPQHIQETGQVTQATPLDWMALVSLLQPLWMQTMVEIWIMTSQRLALCSRLALVLSGGLRQVDNTQEQAGEHSV